MSEEGATSIAPAGGPRFAVGDAVRVRAGVADPDFPDIPLAGWAGTVASVDDTVPPLYLVRWSAATLERVTPAYRVRCEREGMDHDETWLLGADLEPDAGGPPAVVAPQELRPRPLEADDPEDRVRAIFGLTSDDPVPEVDAASLGRFHEHFSTNLSLPQPGQEEDAPGHELLVIQRLLPLGDDAEDVGLVVEVLRDGGQVEAVPLSEVSLLADYPIGDDVLAYGEWFTRPVADAAPSPFGRIAARLPSLRRIGAWVAAACLLVGSSFGATLWSHEYGVAMAEGGGILCGVIGLIVGARSEALLRRTLMRPPGFVIGLLFGGILGLVFGAVVGVLLLASVGFIAGAIAGCVVGQLLEACGLRVGTARLGFLGTFLGAGTQAYLRESELALWGGAYGLLGGAGLFALGFAVMRWGLSRLPGARG